MDSEKEKDSFDKAVQAVPAETRRILDRMVELGWAREWASVDTRAAAAVRFTPEGQRRLRELRELVDGVGLRGLATWLVLDALSRGALSTHVE